MTDYNNSNNSEPEITPCLSTLDSPELQDTDIWSSYDNTFGKYAFHGGMEGYLENKDPSPESPQQECFYDDSGNLIDENHDYAGMRGTANEYDGHGDDISDVWDHFYNDSGGVWENGREAFATSMESYYDSATDSLEELYDQGTDIPEDYYDEATDYVDDAYDEAVDYFE